MQLKRKQSVAEMLAIATCSLLAPVAQNAQAIEEDLDLDMSYLEYQETDRVNVREVDISARWLYDEDNTFSGKIITDAITGATPSGAIKIDGQSQTLTSPSGVAGATGTGGATAAVSPLVDFVDRRVSFGANWAHIYNRLYRYGVGAFFSNEDDYESYGFNGTVARDFNDKLTTVEGGIGFSYDFVEPQNGGIHKELGNIKNDKVDEYEPGEKLTLDWGVSVTQILSRSALIKAGISTGTVDGYLSDPYKVITLINANNNPGEYKYFHEKRPTSRTRNSINVDYNHKLENDDVMSLGYRYFWDTWGVNSHTIDTRYLHDLVGTRYIQYHARFYQQTTADFYYPYLDGNKNQDPEVNDAPTHATADYRLDDMTGVTLGVKFGLAGSLGKFFARAEIMRQISQSGDYRLLTAKSLQLVWTLDFKK